MDIFLRLKELREREKLSRKDFAELIGMDNSQYGKLESDGLVADGQEVREWFFNVGRRAGVDFNQLEVDRNQPQVNGENPRTYIPKRCLVKYLAFIAAYFHLFLFFFFFF